MQRFARFITLTGDQTIYAQPHAVRIVREGAVCGERYTVISLTGSTLGWMGNYAVRGTPFTCRLKLALADAGLWGNRRVPNAGRIAIRFNKEARR